MLIQNPGSDHKVAEAMSAKHMKRNRTYLQWAILLFSSVPLLAERIEPPQLSLEPQAANQISMPSDAEGKIVAGCGLLLCATLLRRARRTKP